jgi:hypothetical protein
MLELVVAAALMRPVADDAVRDRMIALYDQVCLRAFPDDKGVDSAMAQLGARPLKRSEVKIYLHDDPGRGWRLDSQGTVFTILVESPPYHACSVRLSTPEPFTDMGSYPALASAFEASRGGGFQSIPPYDADVEETHTHATGEQRVNTDNSAESLFYFVNTPLTKSAPGTEVRFVHQLASPEAN